MTVLEFVKNYENCVDAAKDKYIKVNLTVKKYIPFLTKTAYAKNIAKSAMIVDDNVKFQSEAHYLLFCRSVIELYTDLEKTTDNWCKEYDALKRSGLMQKIMMELIPEEELKEYKMFVDMALDDLIRNNTTTQAFVTKLFNKVKITFESIFSPLTKAVTDKVNGLSEKDMNKIISMLDKATKQ